ncbi:MAG: cyclic peptide export ABC transporter [Prolixibacteraceae bacterium]|jgi:putative ATP-binding cassette transporter|nr:cyclic peptide export ABC transporter [Prolixibacteraceae bacterium]
MNLLQFLQKESDKPLLKLALFTALSGLSSTGVIALVNIAAIKGTTQTVSFSHFLMFLVVVGIFITTQKYILTEGVVLIEDILNKIRLRLSDKIRRADLLNIERIGNAKIYNRLTQELVFISQMSVYLITALQSAIMLIFIFGYIAFLNFVAAIILLVILLIGVMLFNKNNKKVYAKLDETNKAELDYFRSLTDILDGLKEIKLNRKKSNDLYASHNQISSVLKKLKVATGYLFSKNMVFSQAFIYIVLGAIVFVLPQLKPDFSKEIISTTTAMLFAIGPLSSLVSMIPQYEQLNLSVRNINLLEEELDQYMNLDEVQQPEGENRFLHFSKIELRGLRFQFRNGENSDAFAIGPLDLTINRGETIFLIGGNGSGKTTLLKALTLLYSKLDSGNIYVDNRLVDNTSYLEYRELYSAVFYDFHLFDKLYGLEQVDPARVNELLKLMQIEHKTEFRDNRFTRQNLSTGQRKRLALIVTLLEDKPIFIFDEWAADQDPQFKDYFYDVLLKKLKAEGKTVIAVSHDDRYFHVADRVIKMDYGNFV